MMKEAIDNLCHIGYTPDEARFLYLAAAHSGYFVRRQYAGFIGSPGGGKVQQLIGKAIGRGHAEVVHYWANRLIYHIKDQRVYARLGDLDNRNRREKAPLTVKRKLMCLDFVLAHHDQRFLATEAEKLDYFGGMRGVPLEQLPVRHYQSATPTYFVDRLPIYVSDDAVHFAYVDEGAQTIAGFETFLRQYHHLFVALGTFEVVYVSADTGLIDRAGKIFHRFYPSKDSTTLGALDPEYVRMFQFFSMRRKWEKRDYKGFGPDGVMHYREESQHFAGADFDALYHAWLSDGEDAVRARLLLPNGITARFQTFVLNHDYELFGRIDHAA